MGAKRGRGTGVISRLLTPRNILTGLSVFVLGSLLGVGLFTFIFAKGYAYLGTDPATCAQCHVMEDHYQAWQRSPHQDVATCNDCHMPHDNLVHKYAIKAENGFRHGLIFTGGWTPENIQITELNAEVTNEACLYCHEGLVSSIHSTRVESEKQNCIQCHSDVGHIE